MTFIKRRPYEGRSAFNKAWELVTREMHIQMLAKPSPRRLEPWPNPEYVQSFPMPISPAALSYNASKRLRILSRVPQRRYTPKYRKRPASEHYVEAYNLDYIPTERILELSQPNLKSLKPAKTPTATTSARVAEKKKRKQKVYEQERLEWLLLRSAPKPKRPPSPLPKMKRQTTPLTEEERQIRIYQLSRPHKKCEPEKRDAYKVSPRALHAVPSKRILDLAAHRQLPLEAQLDLAFKPFSIKRSALKYKASKNILKLAEPVLKKAVANYDIKEDAFVIPRRALKAKCSKRTKELAKPVVRGYF